MTPPSWKAALWWYSLYGVASAMLMVAFVSKEILALLSLQKFLPSYPFLYSGFTVLAGTLLILLFFFEKESSLSTIIKRFYQLTLPAVLIFLIGYSQVPHYPTIFKVFVSWYIFSLFFFFFWRSKKQFSTTPSSVQKSIGWKAWVIVFLFSTLFFFFGYQRLGQFAAVDEALWLYGRIPRYFNNIADGEWQKTAISDKPGITVALISGAGLLKEDPRLYKQRKYQGELVHEANDYVYFFKIFRLPILLFLSIFLFLLFFLTQRVFGTSVALLYHALLATSPILIGMAKIINPDSLLWAFTTAAILSFLWLQKNPSFRALLATGILFGLSLLTKYVANILLIFFLFSYLLTFLRASSLTQESITSYWQKSLRELLLLFGIAVLTFYALVPATWIEPLILVESTFASQAFEKFSLFFLLILGFLWWEVTYHKAKLLLWTLPTLQKLFSWIQPLLITIFFGSLIVLLVHVWLDLSWYQFSALLSSPKTVTGATGALGIFLSNFYVGFFSQVPIVAFGLILFPVFFARKLYQNTLSSTDYSFFFILSIILLYYLASVLTGVASIVRYQIMLTPLFILLAAAFYHDLIHLLPKKYSLSLTTLLIVAIAATGIFTLLKTPFPGSYASPLLPRSLMIDVKDMGPGSFEAATFLNTLPHAEDLTVWTDKSGLCNFFVGRCLSSPGKVTLGDPSIDYVVVSSTRANRMTKMTSGLTKKYPELLPLPEFYQRQDSLHTILINNRPAHTVRIFSYQSSLRPIKEEGNSPENTVTEEVLIEEED